MMEMFITDRVKFGDKHKQLLIAQVVLTDRKDRLTTTMQDLAEAQKHTGERIGVLVHMTDGFIRGHDRT
jgi:hypothetical protein